MRSLDFSGLKTNRKIKIKLLNDVLSTRASVQFVSLSLGSLQGSKNLNVLLISFSKETET